MERRQQVGVWWAVVLSLLVGAEMGRAAPSHAFVAEIIGINGQVEARTQGGAFAPAAILQRLASRDAVRTLVQAKAELSFIDQSILILGEKTTLEISQYRLGEREARPARALKVLNGKIRFIVNTFFGTGEEEFSLEAPTVGVGVRGTDGVVECQGATDYVYLFQAKVPVVLRSRSTGEQVELRPGFFAVSQVGRPIRILPLPEEVRQRLLRELSFAFEVRPRGVAIEADLESGPPAGLGPEASPKPALPPVATPPVPGESLPVQPAPTSRQSYK